MRRSDQCGAFDPRQRAIGIVGVSDAAIAVAPDDEIALGFEKADGALLGFLELEIAVGKLLDLRFELAQSPAQVAAAKKHDSDHDAGDRKKTSRTDGEEM